MEVLRHAADYHHWKERLPEMGFPLPQPGSSRIQRPYELSLVSQDNFFQDGIRWL